MVNGQCSMVKDSAADLLGYRQETTDSKGAIGMVLTPYLGCFAVFGVVSDDELCC